MNLFDPFSRSPGVIGGLQIVSTDHVGDPWIDWSGCRSQSRAKRRARRGHPQNTVTRYKANGTVYRQGNTAYMHPDDVAVLKTKVKELRS
jgi:hypothetical protein